MAKPRSVAVVGGGVAAAIIVAVVVASMAGGPSGVLDMPAADVVVEEEKITVLASFYPYYEFARNVAGDRATVMQYMPPGVEAHDWEPRAQEIRLLEEADVFVYNGVGIETYVDQMIDSGEHDHIIFVKASDGIQLLETSGDEEEEHGDHKEMMAEEISEVIEEYEEEASHGHEADPHLVLDEIKEILDEHRDDGEDHGNMITVVSELLHAIEDGEIGVEDGLEEIHHLVSEQDAHMEDAHMEDAHMEDAHMEDAHMEDAHMEDAHGHHDFPYDSHIWLDPVLVKDQVDSIKRALMEADPDNAQFYEQNAASYNTKLDAFDAKTRSALSECKGDTFVPFHNAFTYFAQRYGLNVVSLGGLAPDTEASAHQIAELVDFVRDHDIGVIFSEDLIDPRLAEVIAAEAGAQVMVLSPIEGVTTDESARGTTFLEKMEQNLDALKVALECQ